MESLVTDRASWRNLPTCASTIPRSSGSAARQGGVLTRRQALELGLSPAQVVTALRRGSWTALRHGVYATVEVPATGTPQHLALLAAAECLVRPDEPVVRGRTAAVLHELPILGPLPVAPDLVVARSAGTRHRGDVLTTWLPAEHVTRVRGVRTTSIARTAVDVARASDLLGGVVVLDGALHAGAPRAALAAVLATCRGWRGSVVAAQALALARPGAESALESLGRVRLLEQGLPEPQLQVELRDRHGFVGRVDQLWRAERVIAEADGLSKYTDPSVLRAEKLREDRLRDLGFQIVRYTWDEAFYRPAELAARVRLAFARSLLRAA